MKKKLYYVLPICLMLMMSCNSNDALENTIATQSEELYALNVDLYNTTTVATFATDGNSSIGKTPVANNATFLYLDASGKILDMYYTELDPLQTSKKLELKVPGNCTQLTAFINKSTLPTGISTTYLRGKTLSDARDVLVELPKQTDPIEAVSLYGLSPKFSMPNDCCTEITVSAVPARMEIKSFKLDLSDLSAQEFLNVKSISLESITMHNIYDGVSFSKSVNDGNIISLSNLLVNGHIPTLTGVSYRFEGVGSTGAKNGRIVTYKPKNEVWGFQILATAKSVPATTFKFTLTSNDGKTESRYYTVNSYKTGKGVSITELEQGNVYQYSLCKDWKDLTVDPEIPNKDQCATINVLDWIGNQVIAE